MATSTVGVDAFLVVVLLRQISRLLSGCVDVAVSTGAAGPVGPGSTTAAAVRQGPEKGFKGSAGDVKPRTSCTLLRVAPGGLWGGGEGASSQGFWVGGSVSGRSQGLTRQAVSCR